ncbi:hypothetical protein TKK_0011962 [Trichogramma kaykai]|uniref:Tubulin epsilon and delta complex protein 1 domain-containing protein n=1 Tax=Trichogramma kaykai TaxID=54128 RepID=A0ABD2WPU2_9HYME
MVVHIKEVIEHFCKYLHDAIGINLNPEYLKMAKYNQESDQVANEFWTTLDILTHYVLKEINHEMNFDSYDKCLRTKLRLAFLQFPLLEIYYLTETNSSQRCRYLLLALSWLITKYRVLDYIVRLKLLNSPLGREFSKYHVDASTGNEPKFKTTKDQLNNLLHKTNKLSGNLKAIPELTSEKIKLMTKIHTASITTSGLPHLSTAEMAMIKRMATSKQKSCNDSEKLSEMEKIASLLDTHMKWPKKKPIFYAWLESVMDEYEKEKDFECDEQDKDNLIKFIYLLRHVIKRKLKSFKHDHTSKIVVKIEDCPSKLLRVQKCLTEVNTCLNETINDFESIDSNLQEKRAILENTLMCVLNGISDCVHI